MQVSGHRFQLSWRTIVGGVIAVLPLILILQNTQDVEIHVSLWHADRPLWLWLLLLFVAGFIVGSLFPWANPFGPPPPERQRTRSALGRVETGHRLKLPSAGAWDGWTAVHPAPSDRTRLPRRKEKYSAIWAPGPPQSYVSDRPN